MGMTEYSELFEILGELTDNAEFFEILSELTENMDSITSFITALSSILSLGIAGVAFVVGIITIILGVIASIIIWVLEAIPIFTLAKKMGRKSAWLAWIPIFGEVFRLLVICDISANKPFSVFNGKLNIKNRGISFWIYVGIKYLGGIAISIACTILSFIVPGIGMLSYVLSLLPVAACGIMEYVYLRDVLDIFKEDKKANMTAAIVITALDCTITFGLVRIVYLYTLLKCKPLLQNYVANDGEVIIEPVEVQ